MSSILACVLLPLVLPLFGAKWWNPSWFCQDQLKCWLSPAHTDFFWRQQPNLTNTSKANMVRLSQAIWQKISTIEGNTENAAVSKARTKKYTSRVFLAAAVSSTGERQSWSSTSGAILSGISGQYSPRCGQILHLQGPPLRRWCLRRHCCSRRQTRD